jgi:hypothetical protein
MKAVIETPRDSFCKLVAEALKDRHLQSRIHQDRIEVDKANSPLEFRENANVAVPAAAWLTIFDIPICETPPRAVIFCDFWLGIVALPASNQYILVRLSVYDGQNPQIPRRYLTHFMVQLNNPGASDFMYTLPDNTRGLRIEVWQPVGPRNFNFYISPCPRRTVKGF